MSEQSKNQRVFGTLFSALLGIVILGLVLLISNANKFEWDLTEGGKNSLTPATVSLISELTKEMSVTGFVRQSQMGQAEKLFERYRKLNPEKFHYELHDPVEDPVQAKKFEVTSEGVAFIEVPGAKEERRERLEPINEQTLTNGIARLLREQDQQIVFVTGHGERSLRDDGPEGLSQWAGALRLAGYSLKEAPLGKIPFDREKIAALIVVAPQADLLENEKEILAKYLDDGGSLLMLVEPSKIALDRWHQLLQLRGLDFTSRVILDPQGQAVGGDVTMALGMKVQGGHPMLPSKLQNFLTLYSLPLELVRGENQKGYQSEQVVATGPDIALAKDWPSALSFLEKGEGSGTTVEQPQQSSPLILSVSSAFSDLKDQQEEEPAQEPPKSYRIALVADADVVSNSLYGVVLNRELAMSVADWISASESFNIIQKSEKEYETFTLPPMTSTLLWLLLVLGIPMMVTLTGFLNVFSRRRMSKPKRENQE